MRLAFVIPRYGADILGGEVAHCRDFVERLAAAGHDVEVLTTCGRNPYTWANEFPAGLARVNGIAVHRFPVTRARDNDVMFRLETKLTAVGGLSEDEERDWVMNTGFSEPLLAAIDRAAERVDALIFIPYMFAATVHGARVRPDRSLVIPCLHDEPYARFRPMLETLGAVAGLIQNTDAERRLGVELLGSRPTRVVGIGFDEPAALDVARFRRRRRVDGDFIAYAGRRELGKNWPLLVEWTTLYSRALSRSGPIELLAMGGGPLDLTPSSRDLVRDFGFVEEREKFEAFAASCAVVQLSRNESFSYVVMEGWLGGAPLIVHADCAVTREHCERSGGGLWVRSAEEFSEALDRLRADTVLRDALVAQGRDYVRREYSWPVVLARLEQAIEELVA